MPTVAELFDQAVRLHRTGHLAQAEPLYRQVLQAEPDHAHALHFLGVLAHQTGNHHQAIELIRQAIRCNPNAPDFHFNLGTVLKDQGQRADAIYSYRQALALYPKHGGALINLGSALVEQGEFAEATEWLRQAVKINPNDADAQYNLGNALCWQKKYEEAADCCRQALRINPNLIEAHNKLGSALFWQGQQKQAADCLRQSLRLNPNQAETCNNLGSTLKELNRLEEAEECYRQALSLDPKNAEIHKNLGTVRTDLGDLDEALACYRQAQELEPENPKWHSRILFTSMYHPGYDSRALFVEAQRWNLRHAKPLEKFSRPHDNDPSPERRLRIGYISPNYYMQSETFFTMPLFSAHDHVAFEIICYADVAAPDEITARIRSHADVWRNIVGLADHEVAELVRQDRIDILVDLTMHMPDNRLLVFAGKPSPVQVCWLAYQGTTGLAAMDYRLTDAYVDPPALFDPYYTEKSVRLPDAFGCYDPLTKEPSVNALPALKNGYLTFGSLNNFCKVNAQILKLWARVLRATGPSRLILLAPEGDRHRRHVLRLLDQEGIAADRITFVANQSRVRYLEVYHQIDLGLDTLPYNGQTTSLDSAWMGVPVATMVGHTGVGRAGLSLLSNLGLTDLIAETPEQFVRCVVDLSGDLRRLSQLRATLRDRMRQSPLMDAARFARNVETAYRAMWHTWCESFTEAKQ